MSRRNTLGSMFGRRPDASTIEGHPMIVGTNRVGIEIELEGVRDTSFNNPYWTVKGDGSLRNHGVEFVFSAPYGGVDLYNAILAVDSFLFNKNPDPSWRCSTHIHLDVRGMTVQQLRFLTLAYVVYEKFLFRMSGIHRYKNNFCPAIGFAQQQLEVLGRAFAMRRDNDCISHILSHWDKYSALNFLPISSFGSVEFRLSEAKWRKGMLVRLCNRLLSLCEIARNWSGSERELVDYLAAAEPREIMGQGLPKTLGFDFTEDLIIGQKLAHDILSFAEGGADLETQDTPRATDVDAILRQARELGGVRAGSTFSFREFGSAPTIPESDSRGPWRRITSFIGETPLNPSIEDWHRICHLAARLRVALSLTPPSMFPCEVMHAYIASAAAPGESPETFLSGQALATYLEYLDEIVVEVEDLPDEW